MQCLAASQCRPLTEHEQLRLGWELTAMAPEKFQRAINLVLMRHPGLIATMRDKTIELDVNKMDALTLRQLQDFVKHCNKEKEVEDNEDPPTDQPDRKRAKRSSPTSSTSNVTFSLDKSVQEI